MKSSWLLGCGLLGLMLGACSTRPPDPDVPSVTALTPETHDGNFPIAPGAVGSHGGTDCNECHGAFDTFADFSCIGCHEHDQAIANARHLGTVPGYEYTPTSCFTCHPRSEAMGINHELSFPIASGTLHAGSRCSSCHLDPSNRHLLDCESCHLQAQMDPAHVPVGGYAFGARTCVRCHGDSQVHLVATHLPFGIGRLAKHYQKSCLECHPQSRVDKPFAADFSTGAVACGPCHGKSAMDDKHQNFASYQYTPASCLQAGCHPNGRKP